MGFVSSKAKPWTIDRQPRYLERDCDSGVRMEACPPLWIYTLVDPPGGYPELHVSRSQPAIEGTRHCWSVIAGPPVSMTQPGMPERLPPDQPLDAEFRARVFRSRLAEMTIDRPVPTEAQFNGPADAGVVLVAEGGVALLEERPVARRSSFTVPMTTFMWWEIRKFPDEMLATVPQTDEPGWDEFNILMLASANPGYYGTTATQGWSIAPDGTVTELCRPDLGLPPQSHVSGPWPRKMPNAKVWRKPRDNDAHMWFYGETQPAGDGWLEGLGQLEQRPVRATFQDDASYFRIGTLKDEM